MEGVYHFVMCLVCFFSILPLNILSDVTDGISENTISVRFDKNDGDLLLREEWTSKETENFQTITKNGINMECEKEDTDCAAGVIFVSQDVMVDEKDIHNFNGDMRFNFFVSTGGQAALNKDILTDAVNNSRATYNTELADPEKDYNITLMFVGDVRVAEPVDNSLNIILSVCSVALMLAFCLLALVLKCKENMDAKAKLQAVDGRPTTTVVNEGEEVLTLTAIKSAEDDSKEPSEGSRRNTNNKNQVRVINPNNNLRGERIPTTVTQQTQTTGRFVLVSEHDRNIHSATTASPTSGDDDINPEHTLHTCDYNIGGMESMAITYKADEFVNKSGNEKHDNVKSSRHGILPPVCDNLVQDASGGREGTHGNAEGSERKRRKKRHRRKKRISNSSDDEKNDLLDDADQAKGTHSPGALSPLAEGDGTPHHGI